MARAKKHRVKIREIPAKIKELKPEPLVKLPLPSSVLASASLEETLAEKPEAVDETKPTEQRSPATLQEALDLPAPNADDNAIPTTEDTRDDKNSSRELYGSGSNRLYGESSRSLYGADARNYGEASKYDSGEQQHEEDGRERKLLEDREDRDTRFLRSLDPGASNSATGRQEVKRQYDFAFKDDRKKQKRTDE